MGFLLDKARRLGIQPKSGLLRKAERLGFQPTSQSTAPFLQGESPIASGLRGIISQAPITKLVAGIEPSSVFNPAERQVGTAIEREDRRRSLIEQGRTPEEALRLTQAFPTKSELERAGEQATGFLGVAPKTFKGAKDLTTKFLKSIEGKSTLSRQEIADFANRPELKKGEADLLKRKLEEFTPKDTKIPAKEFAEFMERDLLRLKPITLKEGKLRSPDEFRINNPMSSFKGTSLDEQLKRAGETLKVKGKNYEEVVFESPIEVGRASTHYPNSKKYFAHARGDGVVEQGKKIWREQEVQSDLFAKGRLQDEMARGIEDISPKLQREFLSPEDAKRQFELQKKWQVDELTELEKQEKHELFWKAKNRIIEQQGKEKGLDKLQPFTNDRYGDRVIRERIKQKAKQGYDKYRLPTGETIGKIEGFGQERAWKFVPKGWKATRPITPKELKVGLEVSTEVGAGGGLYDSWIITDILGEGRFKAVPKSIVNNLEDEFAPLGFTSPDDINFGNKKVQEVLRGQLENETFDLTGKSNPQFIRYEKTFPKFIKRVHPEIRKVTDPQGNTWFEIDLTKADAKAPIEAFGIAPFIAEGITEEE